MTTYLHHGSTINDPYMRHELQEPVGEPVTFIQHDEHRLLIAGADERVIFSAREDLLDSFYDRDTLGYTHLSRDGDLPRHLIRAEIALRALAGLGLTEVVVPDSFPVAVADHLRSGGIRLTVDEEAWSQRRRRKTPWEVEGLGRAQRAAEAAMLVGARMLNEAQPAGEGHLRFEGEVLTAEFVREAINDTLLRAGAGRSTVRVQSGDACLEPLSPGHGPLLADESCIIDCFPTDRATGIHACVSRTFVNGTPGGDLRSLHDACVEGASAALKAARPGSTELESRVIASLTNRGLPTRVEGGGDGATVEGLLSPVGHGVGLDLFERPWLGVGGDALVEGDAVAIAPSIAFAGVGGVRISDVVLVTDEGAEHLTEPLTYDLEP
jgi:Xaa-Pro aminopeptidase